MNSQNNNETPSIQTQMEVVAPVFEHIDAIFNVKERFKLSEKFIESYRGKQPNWGPLGYIVYKRTYARDVSNENRSEEYWETVKRIVEGTYTIQLNHCKSLKLYWNAHKAQHSAQEMFRLMWEFKFLPAGRGLWVMGTDIVYKRGNASLLSCAFHSTKDISYNFSEPFCWTADMSLYGVGVGFDTKGAGTVKIQQPKVGNYKYIVHDSKEGWVDLMRVVLESYVGKEKMPAEIDYSQIREKGSPIKTFGGIAPGPDPLIECIDDIKKVLNNRIGTFITSTDIVDIENIVGRCVVSGGVRRCLPGKTEIHTLDGIKNIKDIKVGDFVKTSVGWKPVVNYFKNGRQSVVKVKTEIGEFECTPNHKMKVYVTPFSFEYKEVKDLVAGDKLVFLNKSIDNTYENSTNLLNENQIKVYSKFLNETSNKIDVILPNKVNKNVAWLMGLIHGDGCVRENSVEITTSENEIDVLKRAQKAINENFGFIPKIRNIKNEKTIRLYTTSKLFSKIFSFFKQPKVEHRVPDCIKNSNNKIIAAYLAGLFDSDGFFNSESRIVAVGSIYYNHLLDCQKLISFLGIPSKIVKNYDDNVDTKGVKRKAYYNLVIVGVSHKANFVKQILEPYSVKYNKIKTQYKESIFKKCHLATVVKDYYRYSKEIMGNLKDIFNENFLKLRFDRNVSEHKFNEVFNVTSECTPIDFLGIEKLNKRVMTYDFEVEDIHEFVIDFGLVSSNSAEIALGDYNDSEYIDVKNPEKYSDLLKAWRWCSNVSVFSEVGMDYKDISKRAASNGEPGFVYLDNIKKYGRIKDGVTWADENAMGVNPSLRAGTKVLTTEGIENIEDLENKDFYVKNIDGKISPAKCFLSGKNKQLYKITLSNGVEYFCTPEHKWPVYTSLYDENYIKKQTTEVVPGYYLPMDKSESLFDGEYGSYDAGRGMALFYTSNIFCESINSHDVTVKAKTLNAYKTIKITKDSISKEFWKHTSEEFRKGFVDVLFSLWGGIDVDNIVYISCIYECVIDALQELLGFYGIQCKKTTSNRILPTPEGGMSDDEIKIYTVSMDSISSILHFKNTFGPFTSVNKNSKMDEIFEIYEKNEKDYLNPIYNKIMIENVELTDIYEDVWDITVYDDVHCFRLSNCVTGNCVTGDTLIATADGTGEKRIDEIKDGTPVYCIDDNGDIAVRKMLHPRITGYDTPIYKVVLDDGMEIKCTDNHKFRTLDGTYVELKNLNVGDSVDVVTKYKPTKENAKISTNSRYYRYISMSHSSQRIPYLEHVEIAKYKYDLKSLDGYHVHHLNENTLDNSLDNIVIERSTNHLSNHSMGLNNPNAYNEISNEDLIDIGVDLCLTLRRRFSVKEWQKYALENSLPSQFSEYRIQTLGTVEEFAKHCSELADIDLPDVDPRTLRSYIEDLDAGYNAYIENGEIYIKKVCEVCGTEFVIEHARREQCICSNKCNNKRRDYSKNRAGLLKKYEEKKQLVREKQLKVYLDMKFNLGREPIRKEWMDECSKLGVSPEVGRKTSPYTSYNLLKEAADAHNHRIVSITPCGNADVWNGTVEEFHNFLIGGKDGLTPKGNPKQCWVINANCGEQSLENAECCLLVETFPSMHKNSEEYLNTLKYAYLYAKTVTLVPSHSEKTNQVMLRNRRIGVSMSGIIDAISKFGRRTFLNEFCDKGYDHIKALDKEYSNWLCIPKSIKTNTIKPSGCRTKNSLTTLDTGIYTMEELMSHHISNTEWCDNISNENLYAIQNNNVLNKVVKTYKNGISDIFRIKLNYGLELDSTPNHKYFVTHEIKHGKKININNWVRADEIKQNYVIEMNMDVYNNNSKPYKFKIVPSPFKYERSCDTKINQPEFLTDELSWLFGYLWGDGSLSKEKYRIRFTDQYTNHLEKASNIIQKYFGISSKIHETHESKGDSRVLEIGSHWLWNFLHENGIIKYENDDSTKELNNIPLCIRTSTKSNIIAFISGLVDSDGCVHTDINRNKTGIKLCGSEDTFMKHLQDVAFSVGLCFGRSHNIMGKNLQKVKNIWLLNLNANTNEDSFNILKNNSEKIKSVIKNNVDLKFACETKSPNVFILGKVLTVSKLETPQETFDIEVENEHWYYTAGVKSHNSVSLLPGVSPGIHFPHSEYYIRRIEIQKTSPLVKYLDACGYPRHQSVYKKPSWCYEFPIKTDNFYKSKWDATIWEQMMLNVDMQYYWSDNNVSQTVTFKNNEMDDIEKVLEAFEDKIKVVSFLPLEDHTYEQAPYEKITEEQYLKLSSKIKKDIDISKFTSEMSDVERNEMNEKNKYCDGDTCSII